METKYKDYDINTAMFGAIEIADDNTRAILSLPLMHVGPNKKGLLWTPSMLKKLAPMFRGKPFRYDLNGQEGSSHTINKLSSPHFDVGWSHTSEAGAWYDAQTKELWVKGEVTHPEVVGKLARVTTDGKREVNYGSMGVIVEKSICSICGADFAQSPDGEQCENSHKRLETYDKGICYKVPTEVSKVLHIALTNDPADAEAEIKNVIIQDLSGDVMSPAEVKTQAGKPMENNLENQMPTGMAPSSQTPPAPAVSPETILKDLAERIKTIEQKIVNNNQNVDATPEVLNTSPQDQFTQDNMGTTTQFDKTQTEENTMDVKDGQASNTSVPVNSGAPETQNAGAVDPMSQMMSMLQQILARLGGTETQDMGQEALSANIGQAKKVQDDIPTKGTMQVPNSEDAGNAKNKANMNKPQSVATADNDVQALKAEVADLTGKLFEMNKTLKGNLEIQDSTIIPEFGTNNASSETSKINVADMGAKGRREAFGEYGAWDAIMNGANSAEKFKR